MKTIKNSKDITTLEVGDVVVFGNLEYVVNEDDYATQYYLYCSGHYNGIIFEILNLKKRDFVEKLGIDADCYCDFPETKSLEALTAIVSALFKEYEKQYQLPKTWEEFCKRNKIKEGESFIDCYEQEIIDVEIEGVGSDRDPRMDKNLCTSTQEAEAFLALMQLRQLRKAYVKDWEPNWTNNTFKYCIDVRMNNFGVESWSHMNHSFSFPTEELAEQFLANFKDLLEIAKPLL